MERSTPTKKRLNVQLSLFYINLCLREKLENWRNKLLKQRQLVFRKQHRQYH